MAGRGREGSWSLLTSHGHVLVEIARNPDALMKELAAAAAITERSASAIVADLVDAGYVTRERVGRRNRYAVHLDRGFRHAAQRDLQVGPFLDLLTGGQLSKADGDGSSLTGAQTWKIDGDGPKRQQQDGAAEPPR